MYHVVIKYIKYYFKYSMLDLFDLKQDFGMFD